MRTRQAILVVDDEERIRELIRSLLIGDYDVFLAADGREAMDSYELHAGRIAAVITDVRMPRFDGRELAKWLHGRRPQLPIIVLSGYAGAARPPPRRELVWLEKPFAVRELVATLKMMLGS
ncbi:MAG: response regulator [Acidobacteria bacterium]|nr:response regulator [Acidobacteriota bacterium]